jgi:ATP-dependent RNA helicase DDX55/SPB4
LVYVQIVVGTPGRTVDIINRCEALNLRELEILILDEADTLLDMGFRQEVNSILSAAPKQRRTGLFSATQTKEVKELARAGMRNPVTIAVKLQGTSSASQVTPSTLKNYFAVAEYDERPGYLVNFLNKHSSDKVIVFVATCACVDYYSNMFAHIAKGELRSSVSEEPILPKNLYVGGLHGKMVPKKRSGVYNKFVELASGVLFCTDVAARGIDIPDVDWIVQMAAPKDPSFFVHRVGRTARAGKRGGAIIFVTDEERPYVELLRGRGVPLEETVEYSESAAAQFDESPYENESNIQGAEHDSGLSDDDDMMGNMDVGSDGGGGYENGAGEAASDGVSEMGDNESVMGGEAGCDIHARHRSRRGPAPHCAAVLEAMKTLCSQDRDLLEGGSTAFMSFLRAYKEHQLSYIFRADRLDIGSVARSYGLLRLPRIPETRNRSLFFFADSRHIHTSDIPYAHKEKEAARLRRLEALLEQKKKQKEEEEASGKKNQPKPRDDSDARSRVTGAGTAAGALERKRKKRKTLHQAIVEDWDDLAAETALYNKFKKGKLTKEEYEKAIFSEKTALEMEEDEDVDDDSSDDAMSGSDSDDDEDDSGSSESGSHDHKSKKQKRIQVSSVKKKNKNNVPRMSADRKFAFLSPRPQSAKKIDYRSRTKGGSGRGRGGGGRGGGRGRGRR